MSSQYVYSAHIVYRNTNQLQHTWQISNFSPTFWTSSNSLKSCLSHRQQNIALLRQ